MIKIGPLTITVDSTAQAIYIYLRPTRGFHSCRQEEPKKGVFVDLDSNGKAIGIELLGPGKLEVAVRQLIPKYHIPALRQVLQKRADIEELLASK